MKGTQGQKYINSVFYAGLAADIEPEFLDQKAGASLELHNMHMDNKHRNVIRKMRGDKWFVDEAVLGDQVFLGAIWLSGYVVEFWRDIIAKYTNIYANGLLVAQHADLPGDSTHMLDIDTNNENEIFITDNKQCPIILDLDDMLGAIAEQTYFTDYDKSLYEINKPVDLSQPKFQCLEEIGSGGGLKAGSYAYAMRFGMITGERTGWGPMSPYIPVPYETKPYDGTDSVRAHCGALICGQEPSITPTKFGIRLRLRVNNEGFDFIELKRYTNYSGQPINYTPTSEYIRLSLDADGAVINIKDNQNTVIDFIDGDSLVWAVLDTSEINTYSSIKRSRTIRYYDRRIVLGGIEYESRLISDKDIFVNHSDVSKIAFPFLERLTYDGYVNMSNQVYKKSHRLGERYGFGVKLYDYQGNVLYAVPLKKDTQDYTNYRFPNRRSVIPTAERSYSPYAQNISTIYSFDALSSNRTNYVYEPIQSLLVQKDLTSASLIRNIIDVAAGGTIYDYRPVTPTGIDLGHGTNGSEFSGLGTDYMATAEGCLYNTVRHGIRKSAVGLSIGGVDTTKLPSWVKSFSVVRTPAAGRVVCQGIAMYALTPQPPGSSPSLVKAKDKVWFYSPETDPNIGDKISIFDDIKANPSNYQVQLVSPVGFFTDVYSAYEGDAGATGYTVKIDMLSHAIMGGNDVHLMEPIGFDASSEIGVGEGRVTFGRFRNEYSWPYVGGQGSGLVSSNLTFNIAGASEVALNGYGDVNNRSRTPYLELSLSTELYYYTDVDSESGDTNTSRTFHEPWYIVNIIKEGEEIANNNVNSYNDVGHFIKLESLVGLGNGESDQVFELINERIDDVYTLGETTSGYRYIWVNDQPWLGVDNVGAGSINTYRAALFSAGLFTPAGGLTCYGIYKAAYVLKSTGDYYYISFPYSDTGGAAICPISGAEVKVRYNNNSPIKLFLGDTYVHDAIFAPIDCNLENQRNLSTASGVLLNAPMPYFNFIMSATGYYQPRNPEGGGGVITNVFEQGGGGNPHQMEFIRQWLVSFGCESTVNLPFIYKNYFPNRNYVMRPSIYNAKLDSETVAEYLDDVGVYSYYNTDYPDECLNWGYGGFHLPSGANWDYEKKLHDKVFTEPTSGVNELLSLMKRIQWSTQGQTGYASSRFFIPTNVYDIQNDKATQISILYDVFSDRGNNLYVITDRGVGLLLTDKKLISDAGGNALSIMANEASLIQGELWLNQSIGCPREFWRGKSEGNVKLPNNVKVPVLVFPTYNDLVMFSANNFMEIADNNREEIVESLESIDLTRDFITNLYSVIDEGENNIWIAIGDTTYVFSIDQNNWGAHMDGLKYVKTLYAPYLNGVDDRNVLAHIIGGENVLPPTTTAAPTTTEAPVTTEVPVTTETPGPTSTGGPTTLGPATTAGPTTTFDPESLIVLSLYNIPDGYGSTPFPAWFRAVNSTGESGWIRIYYRTLDVDGDPIIMSTGDTLVYITPGDNNYFIDGLTYPAYDGYGMGNSWQVSKDGVNWESQIGYFSIMELP